MNGLRGTDVGQDTRFKDKEAISIKNTKFPDHFSQKVDLRKVNISVLRQWVTEKITELLRFEDDVVVEYAYGLLENKDDPFPDPRKMQVNLTGFMDIYGAAAFMSELWTLLLSAQNTVGGVPAEFIAKKKAELEKAQREGRSVPPGRAQASDSFDNRPDGNGLPSRPGQGGPGGPHDYRRGPPGRFDDRDGPRRGGYGGGRGRDGGFDSRPRDSGYGNRRGDGYGGPPDRGHGRERDNGYGNRGPPPPRNDDRSRPRSRSPPRFKRRSPSLSRSPPPRRRMSPSPRRRSPSPRRRDRSVTPPLRSQPGRRDRDDSATPPRKRPVDREPVRGRSISRSPPPRKTDRSRSRSRSLSLTPPRRRRRSSSPPPARRRRDSSTPPRQKARNDSTPPRTRRDVSTPPRRRRDDSTPPRRIVSGRSGSRSPSPKRRRASPSRSRSISPPPKREEDVVKKGRGRFTVEDEKDDRAKADKPKKKLEGALAKSKWAD